MAAEATDIVIYESPGGVVEVRLTGDTVWLNLNQMVALFARDKSVISRHLSKIFREGELEKEAAVAFAGNSITPLASGTPGIPGPPAPTSTYPLIIGLALGAVAAG